MKKTAKKDFNVASELLDENAALRGDKVAIQCGDEKVTYKQLSENVNRFANVLMSMGVKPTERVMILLPDSPMFFYAFLGSIKYGAWAVPVNTMLTQADYEYMHADFGAGTYGSRANINAARLSAGVVIHAGTIVPPPPVTLACSRSLPKAAWPLVYVVLKRVPVLARWSGLPMKKRRSMKWPI